MQGSRKSRKSLPQVFGVSLPALLHSNEVSLRPTSDAAGQCDAARPAKNLVRRPSRMARLGQPDYSTASCSQKNIQEPFCLPLLHLFFHKVTFQNSQRGIVNITTPPIFCTRRLCPPLRRLRVARMHGGVLRPKQASVPSRSCRSWLCAPIFGISCASAHAIKFLILAKEFSRKLGRIRMYVCIFYYGHAPSRVWAVTER